MSGIAIRRVQRPTQTLPVLHLEPAIPAVTTVAIEGLVERPVTLTLDELRSMPHEERTWDLHCVWGWSRPACRWRGVPAAALLERAGPAADAAFALVSAAGRRYASCLAMEDVAESLVALELDGAPLAPEHGGPVRFVPPPHKWGYKGVKWVAEIRLVAVFTPGLWETLVGNPRGDVPAEMRDLREEA